MTAASFEDSKAAATTPAPRAQDLALRAVEEAAGGRSALAARLAVLDDPVALTSQQELLLQFLADPANDHVALGTLCTAAGMKVGGFLAFLRQAHGAQALFECYHRIYSALPAVAEDTMRRALPHQEPCPKCRGKGTVKRRGKGEQKGERVDADCPMCLGTKIVVVTPEVERQKLALGLGGLGLKERAPKLQLNQHISANSSSSASAVAEAQAQAAAITFPKAALHRILAASDRMLHNQPIRVIETRRVEALEEGKESADAVDDHGARAVRGVAPALHAAGNAPELHLGGRQGSGDASSDPVGVERVPTPIARPLFRRPAE